jgi:hypothetical protein
VGFRVGGGLTAERALEHGAAIFFAAGGRARETIEQSHQQGCANEEFGDPVHAA